MAFIPNSYQNAEKSHFAGIPGSRKMRPPSQCGLERANSFAAAPHHDPMIFVDFIASISERLSTHGMAPHARVAPGSESLDPTVGLASLDLDASGDARTRLIDGADVLRHLEERMIGIVGINAIAEAISAYARASLGIAVIHCHAGAIADDIIHAGASDGVTNPRRYVRLEEAAQMTSVFCFALPWTREAGDWLRWYWPRP